MRSTEAIQVIPISWGHSTPLVAAILLTISINWEAATHTTRMDATPPQPAYRRRTIVFFMYVSWQTFSKLSSVLKHIIVIWWNSVLSRQEFQGGVSTMALCVDRSYSHSWFYSLPSTYIHTFLICIFKPKLQSYAQYCNMSLNALLFSVVIALHIW